MRARGSAAERPPFRLGLTPVFLENDAAVIETLRAALETAMDRAIDPPASARGAWAPR